MRQLISLIFCLLCVPLGAQISHRDSVMAEARYLKSIYKTDEAIEKLSALVKPEVFDEQVFSELADCHFQNRDYETAVGTYYLLTSRAPENLLYKIRLMLAYVRQNAWQQGIQVGKAVLQQDSIPAVLSIVGDGFRMLEQPDSALYYYRRSLAYRPGNAGVVSKVMGILIDAQDYDGAIAQADAFLAEFPDNTTVAPLKGLAHYRKGAYEEAVQVFQRQEDIGNDLYQVHYYLGHSYWRTKVIYRAEKELQAAWQADSSDVNLAYSIAAVKAERYRPFLEEIKPWLDKALAMLQPDPVLMSRIHQQYGLGYYKTTNSWDDAIAHYKEAYRYNPKFISALSTIAYCYEVKKDYRQALAWYEKFLALAKQDSRAYDFAAERIAYIKSELFMEE